MLEKQLSQGSCLGSRELNWKFSTGCHCLFGVRRIVQPIQSVDFLTVCTRLEFLIVSVNRKLN